MSLALFAECLGTRIECAKNPGDIALAHSQGREFAGDRTGVRALGRSETAVAPATVSRTDRAAAGLRDGAETRRALGNHDADGTARFAFVTDAVAGDHRL